ncbi:cyclin-J [Anabrus simplex]|uniref:cyclin-J n=1 Tax=Anabrus simplex TaxID=316456 RepID=UPI0034DD9AAE
MSQLHDWWLSEYAAEIASTLREREKLRMPFHFHSPEFRYRPYLVNWLRKVSEDMKMCNTCVHLAVYILDIFMDNHAIVVERLNLVTLVCLLLAAKFEERDSNVPKISELNLLVENPHPLRDYINVEFMILKFLNWNLVIPTAAHFAEYFAMFATLPSDLQHACSVQSYRHLQELAQKYIKDFLDQSLLEESLMGCRPSLVAAACVAAARYYLNLASPWSATLCEVTHYNLHHLQPYLNILLRTRTPVKSIKRKTFESPDHGYGTDNSTSSSPEVPSSKR